MSTPKILLWDLETSHNQVLTFGLWNQDIPHNNIQIERHIYCVAYCWYPEKKIHTISILDDPKRFNKNNHDDFYVVNEFRKVIEQADAHVAHFGDRFDMPILNARMIMNGLKPLPAIKSLDTKKIASKYFKFNSNKLDYLAKVLGHKGKLKNPKNLWLDCFAGDIKALKHMIKYNKQDIEALYFVFEKLMPYVKNNPLNASLFNGGATCTNPTCGSKKLQKKGFSYTRTGKFQRYICTKCGSQCDERRAFKQENNILK